MWYGIEAREVVARGCAGGKPTRGANKQCLPSAAVTNFGEEELESSRACVVHTCPATCPLVRNLVLELSVVAKSSNPAGGTVPTLFRQTVRK